MIKNKKILPFFGKMAAMPALFLLMLFAGSTTAYAANYDLYIGNTQVTDANAGNIFGTNGTDGQPTARYDAASKTLYLNGVHIDENHNYVVKNETYKNNPGSHYSMFAGTDVVRHLVITGENSFVSAGSEIVHIYDAIEWNDDTWQGVDINGDGTFGIEDMCVSEVSKASSGIYFSATGSTSEEAFTITGTGTLTSTSTKGTSYNYDNYGVDWTFDEDIREDNIGTALTVSGRGRVYMGDEDGTGPTLKLTGWDVGADFRESNWFAMQGGTVIAKSTKPEQGTGVYLSRSAVFFEGGTIAGYGTYNADDYESGAFSSRSGNFDTTISKEHGMQRVYPAGDTTRPTKTQSISGWCVVGMTKGDHAADTQAVLAELGLDGSGGGDNPGTDPVNPGTGEGGGTGNVSDNSYHTDTLPDNSVAIDVSGSTKNTKIYSVDVEWGAMTFQYEKSSWDSESHTTKAGSGWLVYDNVNDKVIGEKQDAINRITVTNHSNAEVFATLSYTGNDSTAGITGNFTTKTGDTETVFTAAVDPAPAYLTLATADNNGGTEDGQGKETAGSVYFMPNGIGTTGGAVNDIAQWTNIGKITVGIFTEQP